MKKLNATIEFCPVAETDQNADPNCIRLECENGAVMHITLEDNGDALTWLYLRSPDQSGYGHSPENVRTFLENCGTIPNLKTHFFTLGQSHVLQVGDDLLTANTVIRITAKNPRAVMFEHTPEGRFAFEYSDASEIGFRQYGYRHCYDLTAGKFLNSKEIAEIWPITGA